MTFLAVLLAGCTGNPHDRLVRNAESLISQNQLERAFAQLDEIYRVDPHATQARELQIIILLKINQVDGAIEMYKDLANRAKLITFLNETLSNADPDVRANACELVSQTKPSNSVYLLSRAARDQDRRVRRAAVKAFGHFDGKKVRQALENALVDGSWQVRAEAAGSLEKLHDPLAAEVLFQSMLDPDEFVRLKTRRALGAVISDSNVAVYRRALRHSNRTVRTAAALGLASRRDDSATSVLFEALLDPDSSIRVSAARALASSGDRSARPLLRESLSDSNANVRATAALALAELGDVVSTNRLAFLMQRDPAEGVRLAAAQACQVLSPPRALVQIAPPQ